MWNGKVETNSKMEADDRTENTPTTHRMSSLLDTPLEDKGRGISPSLDDCIQQVVRRNGPLLKDRNEQTLKMAASFTNELIGRVIGSSPTWNKYVVVPGTRIQRKTAVLYKQDFGSFVCHVHLKRPTRWSAFVFESGRLPSMYGKIKVNPRDSKEQQMSVLQEWGECTDKAGYLRSDMTLKWFNKGLLKAKKAILKQSPCWSATHLVTAGGTVIMSVTESHTPTKHGQQAQQAPVCFNVKFVPCLDWVKVHDGLVSLPMSARDPFPSIKHSLQTMSRKVAKRDRCTIILEAWNPEVTDDQPQWRLNFMKYEREILKLFDDPSFPFFANDMMVLVESLVLTSSFPLSALTKQVLLQGLLNTMAKFKYEKQSRPLLFLYLLESLQRCFYGRYLRQILVPSVSVLKDAENYEMERTAKGLERILSDITQNPEMMLVHTGLCTKLDALTGRTGGKK